MNLGSSDLEMVMDGNEQIIGLRFLQLGIPKNANIQEYNIQFTADQTDNQNPCLLNIYGEINNNPLPFSSALFNISNRTKTEASVAWSPSDWNQKMKEGLLKRRWI
ncbi:MAG: hypothetical protein ACI9VN_001414 [Patescibacteria group bacterium]|jgi:hypothetical protein